MQKYLEEYCRYETDKRFNLVINSETDAIIFSYVTLCISEDYLRAT